MATLTIELPEGAFLALRRSPQEFAKEMRIAASGRDFTRLYPGNSEE